MMEDDTGLPRPFDVVRFEAPMGGFPDGTIATVLDLFDPPHAIVEVAGAEDAESLLEYVPMVDLSKTTLVASHRATEEDEPA